VCVSVQLGVLPTKFKRLFWGAYHEHSALDINPVRRAEMSRSNSRHEYQEEQIPLERNSTRRSQRSPVSRVYVHICLRNTKSLNLKVEW
jgi:hypothetical protein